MHAGTSETHNILIQRSSMYDIEDREAGEGSSGSSHIEKMQAFQKSPWLNLWNWMPAKNLLLWKLLLPFSTVTSSSQSPSSSDKSTSVQGWRTEKGANDQAVSQMAVIFQNGCYFLEWWSFPKPSICKSQHLFQLLILIICSCLSLSQPHMLFLCI